MQSRVLGEIAEKGYFDGVTLKGYIDYVSGDDPKLVSILVSLTLTRGAKCSRSDSSLDRNSAGGM